MNGPWARARRQCGSATAGMKTTRTKAMRVRPSEGRRDVVEPMTGIEPAYSAWEADVLPLNYIGMVLTKDSNSALVPGKAGRHPLGESKKLTPAQRRGGDCRLAKPSDAADGPMPVRTRRLDGRGETSDPRTSFLFTRHPESPVNPVGRRSQARCLTSGVVGSIRCCMERTGPHVGPNQSRDSNPWKLLSVLP